MAYPLILLAALLLLAAAIHLTLCRSRLGTLTPVPGEARIWFRPFLFAPLILVSGLAVYALAPEGEAVRFGLRAGITALGIWLAILFAEQRFIYAELASAREKRVLIRYTLAMFVSAEAAVTCLLYGPMMNADATTMNLIALVFGTITMNLIVASLHHRAVIQQAECGDPA